jgi:hypothetical protein
VTPQELSQLVDTIAISIRQLAHELESREKAGDRLDAEEIRDLADRLRAQVTHLLSAVGEQQKE